MNNNKKLISDSDKHYKEVKRYFTIITRENKLCIILFVTQTRKWYHIRKEINIMADHKRKTLHIVGRASDKALMEVEDSQFTEICINNDSYQIYFYVLYKIDILTSLNYFFFP